MATRSTIELQSAIEEEPLLLDAGFIATLERYSREVPDPGVARHCKERLDALREVIVNPAQLVFSALMGIRPGDDLRAVRAQHPVLRDPGILDQLVGIADQIEPAAAKEHLRSSITKLKGF